MKKKEREETPRLTAGKTRILLTLMGIELQRGLTTMHFSSKSDLAQFITELNEIRWQLTARSEHK